MAANADLANGSHDGPFSLMIYLLDLVISIAMLVY